MLYREFATQAEIDAQYNPQTSVPSFTTYVDFFTSESSRARAELPCRLSVPYGPTLAEHIDIYFASPSPAAMLLFFHGGYWRRFSSLEFGFVAFGPVSAGVMVVVVNYELCPKVSLGEIVRQSRAAVAWVYRNAASLGGDPERLHVAGHSAGGHLTAMLMATPWERDYGLPANVIKSGCAISGLFDLSPFPHSWLQPTLQLTSDEVRRLSPLWNLPDEAGPLLVSYGCDESSEFRRQSREFLAAWRARGLRGSELPQSGNNHFSAIEGFLDAESPLCQALLEGMGIPERTRARRGHPLPACPHGTANF